MRTLVLVVSCLCGALIGGLALPCLARASLCIDGYDPLRHDRFCDSDSAAFIGEPYDFSGVGRTSSNRWVTMISPSYFVSAAHRFPTPGTTVTFYEGNDRSVEYAHRYLVDDFAATMFWNEQPSDLMVGRLVVPEGGSEAILPEDGIAWYPIVSTDSFHYSDAELLIYGLPDRVGRNVVDKICYFDNRDSQNRCITQIMEFSFAPDAELGCGPDEAYLMSGDSGGPSFVVVDGRIALAGVHYYNYGSNPIVGFAAGDSFVPAYIDQIMSFQIDGDATGDQYVGYEDLNAVRMDWGVGAEDEILASDLTGDGIVGFDDLDHVREHWGQTGPAWWITKGGAADRASAVPEPSCQSLIALLGLVLPGCRIHLRYR